METIKKIKMCKTRVEELRKIKLITKENYNPEIRI